MNEIRNYLDNLWRWAAGRCEKRWPNKASYRENMTNIKKHFTPFAMKLIARLILGGLRYGLIREAGKPTYNRLASMRRRLSLYQDDGNLEHLVDVANLAFLEYVEGDHPKKHFRAADDGEHTGEK